MAGHLSPTSRETDNRCGPGPALQAPASGTGLAPLAIGTQTLAGWAVLAPMAGVTDLAFRLLLKGLGAALVVTEMVSAAGLVQGHPGTRRYLASLPGERPLAVQLFGADPDTLARACELAVAEGADIIDVNMGCPARKVVRSGAGGALLKEPGRMRAIAGRLREICPVPLTVKMRAGWSGDGREAVDLAKGLADCGVDALTVHGRTVAQGYSGQADWSLVARVKAAVAIPVIGNGDVRRADEALARRRATGCDGVMIGRAAVANPWIFQQIADLESGRPPFVPTLAERKALILEHFVLLTRVRGAEPAARAFRGLVLRYTRGLPGSARFRDAFTRIRDGAGLAAALEAYFATLAEDPRHDT